MEKVADLLGPKQPQFNTVTTDCLVSDAMYQMACENVDHLIVLKEEKFMGILTDHDIAAKVLFDERPLKKIRVHEYMTRSIPVVTPEDSLEHCMQMMEKLATKHIAVYDHFDFIGILSAQDLMLQAVSKRRLIFEEETEVRHGYPWTY